MLSLAFSLVSGFRSFNISFWGSMRRFLILEVISSFKEALKFSKELFSIRGDFDLGGPATSTSWFEEQGFLILLVKQNLHLRFYHLLVDHSFFSGFLLLTFCCRKVLSWRNEFLSEILSNRVRWKWEFSEIENSTDLYNCKRLSPSAN